MQKVLIPLSLVALAIIWSPDIAYAKPTLALQSSESSVTQLKSRIRTRAPLIITRGFDALVNSGAQEALTLWSNHGIPIIRNNASIIGSTMEGLIDNAVGECVEYNVIDTLSLTEKTKIIFVESQHDEGALFWRFTVHESPKGPVITSMDFNTDPSKIMPIQR